MIAPIGDGEPPARNCGTVWATGPRTSCARASLRRSPEIDPPVGDVTPGLSVGRKERENASTTTVIPDTDSVTVLMSARTAAGTTVNRMNMTKADVSLEKAEAVVAFDDAKTNVEALVKATAGAGFPSKLKRRRERRRYLSNACAKPAQ